MLVSKTSHLSEIWFLHIFHIFRHFCQQIDVTFANEIYENVEKSVFFRIFSFTTTNLDEWTQILWKAEKEFVHPRGNDFSLKKRNSLESFYFASENQVFIEIIKKRSFFAQYCSKRGATLLFLMFHYFPDFSRREHITRTSDPFSNIHNPTWNWWTRESKLLETQRWRSQLL